MAYDDAAVDAAVPTTGPTPDRVNTNALLKELSGSVAATGSVWTVQVDGSSAFEPPSADLTVELYDPDGVGEQVVGRTAVQLVSGKTIYTPLAAGLTFTSGGSALDLSGVTTPRPIIPVTVDNSPIASVTPPDWSTGHPADHEVGFLLRLRRGTSDVVITDVAAHANVTLRGSQPVAPAGQGLDVLFWSEDGVNWVVAGRPLQTGADGALVSGTAGADGNLAAWNADGDAVDAGVAASGFQTADTDLTALAGISANGLLARTGAGTAAARSIAAGANLGVTNADGAAGNPTVSMADMAEATVKGRASGAGTGAPVNLTAAQVNAIVGSSALPMGGNIVNNYANGLKRLSGAQTLNDATAADGDTLVNTGAAATWTLASRLSASETARSVHILIRNRGSGAITIAAGGLTIVGDTGTIAATKSASLEWEHDGTTERVWIEISA
jgi:hypothetical protein